MKPNVIDISHWETVTDFSALKQAGIEAVICKATEGLYYVDPTYQRYALGAREAGMLVGAYHFGTSENVDRQVDRFLNVVGKHNKDVLLALDWEPNPRGPEWTMTHAQAREFCRLVFERTGKWPVLYSGHVVKKALAGDKFDEVLTNCRLWLAHYNPVAQWPRKTWPKLWLHQYSENGRLPGIPNDEVDLNFYDGENLAADWWSEPAKPSVVPQEVAIGIGGLIAAFLANDWFIAVAFLLVAGALGYWAWRSRK